MKPLVDGVDVRERVVRFRVECTVDARALERESEDVFGRALIADERVVEVETDGFGSYSRR